MRRRGGQLATMGARCAYGQVYRWYSGRVRLPQDGCVIYLSVCGFVGHGCGADHHHRDRKDVEEAQREQASGARTRPHRWIWTLRCPCSGRVGGLYSEVCVQFP